MMEVFPIQLDGYTVLATHVQLPKTDLLVISTETGYVMCGALDIQLLRTKLEKRGIIAARATGVKTIQQLLDGEVESCTQGAEALGIHPGMPIRQALLLMKRTEVKTGS